MNHKSTTSAPSTLSLATKVGYAFGDHTLNLSLSVLTLFYLKFLTETVALDVRLAGTIFLVGRFVDAITDPIMGKISDATPWKAGRRRPYFLIGAIPFGLSFALLWQSFSVESQTTQFIVYCGIYIFFSVASTILAVPYLALLPELAQQYHERTTLSTYRSIGSVLGTLLAAVATLWLVTLFGDGTRGYRDMGIVFGIWLAAPWILVFFTTYERFAANARTPTAASVACRSENAASTTSSEIASGLRALITHRSYQKLVGIYLFARMAVDLTGSIFVFYFAYWLARPEDLPSTLATLLVCVVASLPIWLKISQQMGKRTLFLCGVSWWVVILILLFFATPEWPRWTLYALAAASGAGYAVADMMPWSMLGDVIDEDELRSGERREGLYSGVFTFVRKLGGGLAVFLIGLILGATSFVEGSAQQPASAIFAIRALTSLAPAVLLAFAAWIAASYPLSAQAHAEILRALEMRSQRKDEKIIE